MHQHSSALEQNGIGSSPDLFFRQARKIRSGNETRVNYYQCPNVCSYCVMEVAKYLLVCSCVTACNVQPYCCGQE